METVTGLNSLAKNASKDTKTLLIVVAPFEPLCRSFQKDVEDLINIKRGEQGLSFRCCVADDEAHDILDALSITALPVAAFYHGKFLTKDSLQWTLLNPSLSDLSGRMPREEGSISSALKKGTAPGHTVTSRFRIQGLCCEMEVAMIGTLFKERTGIVKYQADPIGRKLHVEHDPTQVSIEDIIELLNAVQLGASIQESNEPSAEVITVPYAKLLQVGIMLGCMTIACIVPPASWTLYVSSAFGLVDLVYPALRKIVRRETDMVVLMALAFVATVVRKDFFEATELATLYTVSVLMTDEAMRRVHNSLLFVSAASVPTSVTMKSGTIKSLAAVAVDDIVSVRAGEQIPVDGMVVAGNAAVDESSLTGEVHPVQKRERSRVAQGTVIQSGFIDVRVMLPPDKSTMAQITRSSAELQEGKTAVQAVVDRIASFYTPVVLFCAFYIAIVMPLIRQEAAGPWLNRATMLLVLGCPCALVMATPTPLCVATATAARKGLLVKRNTVFEILPKITQVVFDKTGTLTDGLFQVVASEEIASDINILQLAASVESKSTHPAAVAITQQYTGCVASAIEMHGTSAGLLPVTDFEVLDGIGVSGVVRTHNVLVGNVRAIEGAPLPESFQRLKSKYPECMHLYVLINKVPKMAFVLHDKLRPEACASVKLLHAMNVHTSLLTGDRADIAQRVQLQTGVRFSRGGLKPRDKVQFVQNVQNPPHREVVVMIGDGVNDSLAIAAANVGMSMTLNGSALATQVADVAFVTDDLRRLPQLLHYSSRVWTVVIANIMISILLKLGMIMAATYGVVPLWLAVLSDVGALLLVILLSTVLFGLWPENTVPDKTFKEPPSPPLVAVTSLPSNYNTLNE